METKSETPRTLIEQLPREQGLADIRCPPCGRLLFKAGELGGTVEIKCPKCGKMTTLRGV